MVDIVEIHENKLSLYFIEFLFIIKFAFPKIV